ncbi:hypothetical protein [Kribbella sp. NPDC003557]|uniref:hypothetical protein n=1 Tax=Kribbella sp. NPDC003557 TaxID=3154449 RepID=UPI0033A728F3
MNTLAAVMIALQTVQPPQPTITFGQQTLDATIGQTLTLESTVTQADGGSRMIAHLNVTSLDGTYVDLEDWARDVTRPVPPTPETQLDWEVQAVNAGHFAVYAVLLPGDNTPAVVSPPVHVTVTARQTLNTGAALPIAIITPATLGLAALGTYLRRLRR